MNKIIVIGMLGWAAWCAYDVLMADGIFIRVLSAVNVLLWVGWAASKSLEEDAG